MDVDAYWGAGFLEGRFVSTDPIWRYDDETRPYFVGVTSMLDMGTGEGGILAGLAPLPPHTVAYEGWLATVRRRDRR